MSKIVCVCGEILTTSGYIPNPIEWLYISDVAYEPFFDVPVAGEKLYEAFGHAFVCPRSGHIWVYREGMGEPPTCYAPTDAKPWGEQTSSGTAAP